MRFTIVIIVDVVLHSDLPETHSVTLRFSFGFLTVPTIVFDSIDGDDSTRAIRTSFAVNEER